MNELETLLNSLIQMGMKPFGIKYITNIVSSGGKIVFRQDGKYQFRFSLRELVSLESGLWQFCVEKKLYKNTNIIYEKYFGINQYRNYYDVFFEYRLIESALLPEEELGKFLVDNIKIEGKKE